MPHSLTFFGPLFSLCTLLITLTTPNIWAVRFQTENYGDGPKVQYPAQKGLDARESEIFDFAKRSHLAAVFAYAHLTSDVTSAKNPASAFIDLSVDLILANSPKQIQAPLRRMYYYNENLKYSDVLSRDSLGQSYHKVLPLGPDRFEVFIESELTKTETLLKLYKLMAVIELSHWAIAFEKISPSETRLIYPVVDIVSKISSALYVIDLANKMGLDFIIQELQSSNMRPYIKSALERDFIRPDYMRFHAVEWSFQYEGTSIELLSRLTNELHALRLRKSQDIKGLSAPTQALQEQVRLDLIERTHNHDLFTLAREAKSQGDRMTLGLLSQLTTAPRVTAPACGRIYTR